MTDVLQDPRAAVLSARCVLSFQAKMSWVFQLLVRKVEDATSSAAERLRGNTAIRRYDAESAGKLPRSSSENGALSFFGKISVIAWLALTGETV